MTEVGIESQVGRYRNHVSIVQPSFIYDIDLSVFGIVLFVAQI